MYSPAYESRARCHIREDLWIYFGGENMSGLSQRHSGTAEINGAGIYYEVAGEGYPLLLIHAGVADSRMWDDQFDLFAQHFRVIRYDMRGFGRTHVPSGAFAGYEDAAGLLDFLDVTQTHVIGVSYGGKVALDFALAYPQRVTALVLGAPSAGGHQPSADVLRFVEAEEAALERGDLAAATELNVRMWVDGPYRAPEQVNPAVRQRVREMQGHAFTVPMPADAQERALTPPAITRLAEVGAPTLILVGDQDIPDKLALAERLAAEIPGAQKAIIPGVAHMLNMEKPQVFNQLALDFLHSGKVHDAE
jgi:pimeloyl-ACP methyl ester carboxylesterase